MGKPLVGVMNDGPADAAVLKPLMTQGQRGIALGAGINPYYGMLDPYAMAWAVIDEAVRNVVAVGADPDRIAILDNFCWGSPRIPERLGGLVRAAQGCHDAALAYGTPFISGKDSLNNEFVDAHGDKRAIPPTLLISALGIVPDVRQTVTSDLKRPGDRLYLVGATRDELGGSLYERLTGETGGSSPRARAGRRGDVPRAAPGDAGRLGRRCARLLRGWGGGRCRRDVHRRAAGAGLDAAGRRGDGACLPRAARASSSRSRRSTRRLSSRRLPGVRVWTSAW